MKIAVIGAAGNVGRHIVSEALARRHQITAIGPNREKLQALESAEAEVGDITNPATLSRLLVGHDAVASAVRFTKFEPDMLLDAVRMSGVGRLAVVGGAGSLRAPSGALVAEAPTFPEAFKPEAAAGARLLSRLRAETEIDWTFLSPSAKFFDGKRTGLFRLGDDNLLILESGESSISFGDYAIAFLDELEQPSHSRRRFTVGY